jgi:hypothetical protein
MKKDILILTLVTATIFLMSACSGGGGGGDASFSQGSTNIAVVDCNSTVNIPDGYTTMIAGDALVQDITPTVITTYHDTNGTKKVCTVSGKAHLVR